MRRRDAATPPSAAIPPGAAISPGAAIPPDAAIPPGDAGDRGTRSIRFRVGEGPRRIVCPAEDPTETRRRFRNGDRVVGIGAVRPGEARRGEPVVPASAGGLSGKTPPPPPRSSATSGREIAESGRELLAVNLPALIFDQRPIRETLEVPAAPGFFVGRRPAVEESASAFGTRTRLERTTGRAAHRQPPPADPCEDAHRTQKTLPERHLQEHPAAPTRLSPRPSPTVRHEGARRTPKTLPGRPLHERHLHEHPAAPTPPSPRPRLPPGR